MVVHDLDSMIAAIDDHTAVVWLCSPNNPTGVHITKDKMISFLTKYQNKHWWLLMMHIMIML